MPRFLILDTDGSTVDLIAATSAQGGVRVERELSWPYEGPIAAEFGQRLREQLRDAKVAGAPLVVLVGRERLTLKEVKHPAVAAHEEPGLVRFQAIKELGESPDDVVLDYQALPTDGPERRAIVFALRRTELAGWQAAAKAAGVKLAGVLPRAIGLVAALPPAVSAAVLAVASRGGEFVVGRDGKLTFARSVPAPALSGDAAITAEVRRNLAVAGGTVPIRSLYVTGRDSLCPMLGEKLAVPVLPLDPPAGRTAGLFGTARLAARGELPVNFLHPRAPKPPRDPHRRTYALAAGLAAAIVLGVAAAAYAQIAAKDRQVAALLADRDDIDALLRSLDADDRRVKAVDQWLASGVVWLDELYDLTARVPDINKLRIVQLTADPLTAGPKSRHVARVTIRGLLTDDSRPLTTLMNELVKDGPYRVEPKVVGPNTLGYDRRNFFQQFSTRYDVEPRPPEKYVRGFDAQAPERARPRRGGDIFDLIGGGMLP